MKILLTGASGQLGKEIIKQKPKGFNLIPMCREKLDLSSYHDCYKLVEKQRPDWIINAGAFTSVDNAEFQKETVLKINAFAPKAFAESLLQYGGKLLQISTDYVFNGKQNYPYKTFQKTSPINYYGKSKALAEKHIQDVFLNSGNAIILRTSWLIGKDGKNFAKSIINLIKNNDQINVVQDQIGCLTTTISLAKVCWDILKKNSSIINNKDILPILHWTDGGVASWYDIAENINELSFNLGITNKKALINPINSTEYKTKAKRPKFSLLDCKSTQEFLGYKPLHWTRSLNEVISDINF